MESEKSGFVNEMSEIWRKMQVKNIPSKKVHPSNRNRELDWKNQDQTPKSKCRLQCNLTSDAGHVHDVAFGGDEVGDDLPGEDEGGRGVDGHAALVVLKTQVGGGAAHKDAGRVHEDIECCVFYAC